MNGRSFRRYKPDSTTWMLKFVHNFFTILIAEVYLVDEALFCWFLCVFYLETLWDSAVNGRFAATFDNGISGAAKFEARCLRLL